jgi:hypothetical protein
MAFRQLVVSVCLIASLAACQTTNQLAQQDDLKCTSFGLKPGTQGYAQCRLSMNQDHSADQAREDDRREDMLFTGLAMLRR